MNLELYDLIIGRRSIRQFVDRPVEPQVLDKILEAAFYAPSAHDRQPWRLITVTRKDTFGEMQAVHPYLPMLNTAAAAVLVCGDLSVAPEHWQMDCSAAVMNMLLAAKALDVGSCWCAVAPHEDRMAEFSRIFELPEQIAPFAVVALGYTDVQKPLPKREIASKIHYETW